MRARTADNQWITLRAATGIEPGRDFAVVWLLEEERWEQAVAEHQDARKSALPWPAEDVQPLEEQE